MSKKYYLANKIIKIIKFKKLKCNKIFKAFQLEKN